MGTRPIGSCRHWQLIEPMRLPQLIQPFASLLDSAIGYAPYFRLGQPCHPASRKEYFVHPSQHGTLSITASCNPRRDLAACREALGRRTCAGDALPVFPEYCLWQPLNSTFSGCFLARLKTRLGSKVSVRERPVLQATSRLLSLSG